MASVASQLIEEVTEHAQSDSLEDAREICADGTYFPNNLRSFKFLLTIILSSLCFMLQVLCSYIFDCFLPPNSSPALSIMMVHVWEMSFRDSIWVYEI